MIKILKKGYKTKPEDIIYYKKCRTCGCCFTYNDVDIKFDVNDWDVCISTYIVCPDCHHRCNIGIKIKYKEEKHGKIQKL